MPDSPNISLVFVLGMHRSGTSVAARAMQMFGYSNGTKIMVPNEYQNPKGFFEDMDFMAFNEKLLASVDAIWSSVNIDPFGMVLPTVEQLPEKMRELFPEGQELLKRLLSEHSKLALKDPRACRLMPFWNAVCISLRVEPSSLIVFRQRSAVAQSLHRRDGMHPETALRLRMEHNNAAILGSRRYVALVWYEEFIAHPWSAVEKIAMGLQSPTSYMAMDEFLEFLEPALNHA